MSKEKSAAWRSMREVSDKDARTMQEMHASQFLLRNEVAPRVTDAPEEQPLPPSFRSEHEKKWATPPEDTALAMRTLWQSERKINLNGKWYVPISEVADILTTPTEEPLSEEWQARTFPNLNIGKRNKEEQ